MMRKGLIASSKYFCVFLNMLSVGCPTPGPPNGSSTSLERCTRKFHVHIQKIFVTDFKGVM